MPTNIQLRRDTAANWTATNPILMQGEAGLETDTTKLKIGNGADTWTELDYFAGEGGGDADTLQGQAGAYYRDRANHTGVQAIGTVTGLQAALDAKTTPAYVDGRIAEVIDSSPAALDTLNELAAALGDDANFAASTTTALALKAPLASPTFTGTPTAPTAGGGTNNTQVATTAFVVTALGSYQPVDATLTALAAFNTNGIICQTAADTFAGRSLAGSGCTITNPQGVAGNPTVVITESLIIAVGDETTAITTGNAKVTFRMPYAFTLTGVRASLTTASSSGTPTIDINDSGTTILSTKITIDANEKTSTSAATPAVISDTSLADDAEITIDIDVAGTGAAGLKVYLIGRQT